MKRRASLLFGLGVLVSLSMSVPTYAATDNTQSIPQTQEAQQNEEGTEISSYKYLKKQRMVSGSCRIRMEMS